MSPFALPTGNSFRLAWDFMKRFAGVDFSNGSVQFLACQRERIGGESDNGLKILKAELLVAFDTCWRTRSDPSSRSPTDVAGEAMVATTTAAIACTNR